MNCNYGFSNTGVGCVPLFAVAQKLIFVPYFDSTGLKNTVDTTQTLNSAFFSAFINQKDPSKRWFPTPFMKNATNVRGESVKESFDDTTSIITQQAARKFMAKIIGKDASPQLLRILLTARTLEMGVYVIDKDGNLIGMRDLTTPTNLNPIRIDTNSFDPIFNPGEDKTVQKIDLGFDIHVSEKDQNLQMLSYDEVSIAFADLIGLYDVSPVYSNISTSTNGKFTVQLNTVAGSIKTPVTVKGLLITDFYDITGVTPSRVNDLTIGTGANAAVTITSVTERLDSNGKPSGIYDFVLAGNVTATTHAVQLTPKKAGFDFTQVTVNYMVSV